MTENLIPQNSSPIRKRRDAARTKAAILKAAQQAFSSSGFVQTGLREIAARAGVDVALVARYFGSKEALFEATLAETLDVSALLLAGRAGFGQHVAALLAGTPQDAHPTAMMVLAAADARTQPIVVRLLEDRVIDVLATWLADEDARLRAAQISILCAGFITYYRLLPLPEARTPACVEWLGRTLQGIVDR